MAQPIDFHPTPPSGDFLSENFDSYEVKSYKMRETDRSHLGVTFYQEEYAVEWEDTEGKERSNRYIVTSSDIPSSRRREASDVTSLETSAWLTRFGGINKRRQLAMAQDFRVPSTFIGVQQEASKFGHIEDNARNHLFIVSHIADRFGRDKANLILNGISRGAMHGLATHAIAGQHGINVVYSDNIVPCFPNGLNPYTDLVDFLKFFPNEINSVRALKLPLRILRHYPHTLDGSLHGLFQQLKEAPTLLAGRMGELVDEHMDRDAFGYVAAYGGDIMSQGNRWLERFDETYPNMTVSLNPEGAHMSCISTDCYDAWYERMQTIAETLHEDRTRVGIGATALHAIVTAANPIFDKRNQYDLAA